VQREHAKCWQRCDRFSVPKEPTSEAMIRDNLSWLLVAGTITSTLAAWVTANIRIVRSKLTICVI
jgi:hypothetical protein